MKVYDHAPPNNSSSPTVISRLLIVDLAVAQSMSGGSMRALDSLHFAGMKGSRDATVLLYPDLFSGIDGTV
jgi:hypothetical protein